MSNSCQGAKVDRMSGQEKKTNTVVEIQTVFIEPVPALYNG